MDLSRAFHRLLWTCVVTSLGAGVASANELGSAYAASDFVVHDAATTLRDFCQSDEQNRLWLTLPNGGRFELITSTSHPDIANPGDGQFHPFDEAEIRAALAQVRFPLRGLVAEIFVLPYPRRGQLESAAGDGLILLAPGVRPLRREQQHSELVHELGHVVQYARMPDGDSRWDEYRSLRSIQDVRQFSASSSHANRPHEIFAEDFRALFGGSTATYSGTIENDALSLPSQVAGLDAFLLALAGPGAAQAFSAWPNPAQGAMRFSWQGGKAVPLDLFDAAGRRIAQLEPERRWNSVEWTFDPRGTSIAERGGVIYARPRGARGAGARIVLISPR